MAIATAPTVVETELTPQEKRHFASLEKRIKEGLETFRQVGAALLEIRDSRLYRQAFETFDDYCRDKWHLDQQRAYQFMGAAEVVKALGDPEGLTNEAQARELVPLLHKDPKAVKAVWDRVVATNEPVTAPLIRRVVSEMTAPNGAPPLAPTLADQVIGTANRLVTLYRKWDASKPSRRERAAVEGALAKIEDITGE